MRNVILGLFDIENSKFNFVILHVKCYIYKCKWDESKPNYNVFIKILKTCKDTEKMIALKNNRVDKWNSKWNKICDLSLDVFKFDPFGGFHFMSFDIVPILMMDCFIAFTIMYMYCTICFSVFVRDMIL